MKRASLQRRAEKWPRLLSLIRQLRYCVRSCAARHVIAVCTLPVSAVVDQTIGINVYRCALRYRRVRPWAAARVGTWRSSHSNAVRN